MRWDSPEQAKRMTGLVMRHMNDIIWQLTEEPEHYAPLLFEHDHEDGLVLVIDEWCTGFIRGAMLDGEAWEPLFESDECQGFLLPIILYGTDAGWHELEQKPELAERHDEFAESLADCVLAIQDCNRPADNVIGFSGSRHIADGGEVAINVGSCVQRPFPSPTYIVRHIPFSYFFK